jgi:hypothetical protein
MHARYYKPLLGRLLSVDQGKSGAPKSPQSWNRYSYVGGNPVNRTDPTGNCSDPGDPGTRICIEPFIPTRSFGGFKGDNRGAQSDGGTFRTKQTLNVSSDDKRKLLGEHFEPGVSKAGPLAADAHVSEHDVLPTASGLQVSAKASDGLLLGLAPNLSYNLNLSQNASGEMSVTGTHSAYPSLEVWVYQDGKQPQLIYIYNASAKSVGDGLSAITTTIPVQQPPPK